MYNMKRIPTLIVKWFANKLGYKIVMLKAVQGTTTIEGDRELLQYVDITGYFFKKEPLSRIQPSKQPTSSKEMFLAEPKPDATKIQSITKLTPKQLKELGL